MANEKLSTADKETVLAAFLMVGAVGTAGHLLGASNGPNGSDAVASRPPSETTVDSTKPALSEFLKQAQLRFKIEPTDGAEREKQVNAYARNFLNYARNFLNYARNFSNYTRSTIVQEEPRQHGYEAALPNGNSVPKDVAEILDSIVRSRNGGTST